MSYYTPPRPSLSYLYEPPALLPTVKIETASPSAFSQHQAGLVSETGQDFVINHGEVESTTKGDYVQTTERVLTATGSYEVDVVSVDIGAGTASVPVEDNDGGGSTLTNAERAAQTEALNEQIMAANAERNPIPETAPVYDTSNPQDPFFEPENSAPPVQYAPLPVEQAPPDEPEVYYPPEPPPPDPFLFDEPGISNGGLDPSIYDEGPFVISHGGGSNNA